MIDAMKVQVCQKGIKGFEPGWTWRGLNGLFWISDALLDTDGS